MHENSNRILNCCKIIHKLTVIKRIKYFHNININYQQRL